MCPSTKYIYHKNLYKSQTFPVVVVFPWLRSSSHGLLLHTCQDWTADVCVTAHILTLRLSATSSCHFVYTPYWATAPCLLL